MSGEVFTPKYLWCPDGKSKADLLRANPPKAKALLSSLSEKKAKALKNQRDFWARPKQLAPPPNIVEDPLGWQFWVYLAGRGTGKTRLAAEWVKGEILAGRAKRIVLAAPTFADCQQTMLEGESGLRAVFDGTPIKLRKGANNTIRFLKKNREIAIARLFTGEEPERFRGWQCDLAWFDELAAFQYLEECWKLWIGTFRLGSNPRAIFTTTPKASLTKVNLLTNDRTVVTFAKSEENKGNLAPGFYETLVDVYQDTDFAAQELDGVLYLDNSGSLFKSSWINTHRVTGSLVKEGSGWALKTVKEGKPGPTIGLSKMIVAVDPSGSSKDSACECGIVVAGLGHDGTGYVIDDLSKRGTPDEWGTIAVNACIEFNATAVYESNYGAEMVGTILKRIAQSMGKVIRVTDKNAQKDKAQRAMIASPYVQKGKMRFFGQHKKLEEQMTLWEPGSGAKSPDRMDAFVWATLDLMQQVPRGVFNF